MQKFLKFRYAVNILLNINVKRWHFYNNILNYEKEYGNRISRDKLLEIGDSVNLTKNYLNEEVIGCLYANYLVGDSYNCNKFTITDRAIKDFELLHDEGSYQKHQIGIIIIMEKNIFRIFIWLVESLDEEFIMQLLGRGWTKNKSKLRLMKKCRTVTQVLEELKYISNSLSPYDNNKKTFKELITENGRYWNGMDTYTANLYQRREYESKTLIKYKEFYKELIGKVDKCIDWGGSDISYNDLNSLAKQYSYYNNTFINECIYDGMLRYLPNDKMTITGHATSVIKRYYSKVNRLDLVIRNEKQNGYRLMIGNESNYSIDVLALLKLYSDFEEHGWYNYKEIDIERLIYILEQVIKKIQVETQLTFFD